MKPMRPPLGALEAKGEGCERRFRLFTAPPMLVEMRPQLETLGIMLLML